MSTSQTFAVRLVRWQRTHGRHDLPWQRTRDPYRIWLSEIMLQQTQVSAVIPYYERFLARFPDVRTLAEAQADEVMRLWAGLGYYSRARNLHAAARRIMETHGGRFPTDPATLEALPGIGRSTAAAIAAFAADARAPILDGNVKRVLCRVFGVEGHPGTRAVENRLWSLAESLLPDDAVDMPAYTQGLMDLGATVCVRARPRCAACPMRDDCIARVQGRTAELPAARPPRAVPRRGAAMLVLRSGDRVLVERRPPVGIWGGLWSLPQCEDEEGAVRGLAAGLAGGPVALEALSPFEHAFTHFVLQVRPWLGRLPGAVDPLDDGRRWLPLAEVPEAGLPQPVKRLLMTLSAPGLF